MSERVPSRGDLTWTVSLKSLVRASATAAANTETAQLLWLVHSISCFRSMLHTRGRNCYQHRDAVGNLVVHLC